jgi:hypothetical protein
MTLANLLKISRLQEFTPSAEGVQRLLESAARNLNDAHLTGLSADNRFDAAYKTIMQCAMIGLWANGYRTSTNHRPPPDRIASPAAHPGPAKR